MPADQKITVSMSAALAGDPKHNLEIKNGDTIYVPNLTVYVSGEVKTPGRYLYEENMTVLMAITMAQGLTDKASSRSVKIIRDQDGTKKTIKVNMDDPVRPGDNIVVPESWF
jgi:polysaccharide export outer membrane protein